MRFPSVKRAAALAVFRYGADRVRVTKALQSVLKARLEGKSIDLLEVLVLEHVLTTEQADQVRVDLNATTLDPKQNGKSAKDTQLVLRTLGDFRILRRIGEGGMGSVYLGYHEGQKLHVAIKVLADHLTGNQVCIDRFYREAKTGTLLEHPNIVRTYIAGQDRASGKHYLVQEFVDGPSSHALLDRFERLPVGDAIHIALDIAQALEYLHARNFVHRDIKPDNILISPSGVAKLADLGLAKRIGESSHLTATNQGFGTPYYMPYEQCLNARCVDGRSDIYALGATLYHLVTGQVPFPGDSHLEIVEKKNAGVFIPASFLNANISEPLDAILEKMLARNPRDRYQTASELIVDLERSKLAAAVPSFVDMDQALQDPLVRARLSSSNQPTRPALEELPNGRSAATVEKDAWYLRYPGHEGQWRKTRVTTKQLVECIRENRLPEGVEASRQPQVGFLPLAEYPEIEEAVAASSRRLKPVHMPSASEPPPVLTLPPRTRSFFIPSRWLHWHLLLGVSLGVGLLAALTAVVCRLVLHS